MNPQLVHNYSAGDSFGELALLYDAPRAATVKVSVIKDFFGFLN